MAIDTAKKRRASAGVPLGLGVTPSSLKDLEWRRQVGWSYLPLHLLSLSSSITLLGICKKEIDRIITDIIGCIGTIQKKGVVSLSRTVTLSGSFSALRLLLLLLSSSLSLPAASLARLISHARSGSLGLGGSLSRRSLLSLIASCGLSGVLSKTRIIIQYFETQLNLSSSYFVKKSLRKITGVLGTSPSLLKLTTTTLSDTMGMLSSLRKTASLTAFLRNVGLTSSNVVQSITKRIGEVLGLSGATTKRASRRWSAALGVTGSLIKRARKILGGILSWVGSLASLLNPVIATPTKVPDTINFKQSKSDVIDYPVL